MPGFPFPVLYILLNYLRLSPNSFLLLFIILIIIINVGIVIIDNKSKPSLK